MLQRFKILFYPFALLYALVVRLRNHLYNIGYKKEITFDVMTIGVGNLVMGGTGKTPFTEYLIRILRDKFKIAVLSRGYGRTSTGFKILSKSDSVKAIGDEPMQVFRKFGDEVVVAVGENRLLAIPQILREHEDVNMIVLDDIFQHRKVKPAFNIMLTNHDKPFYFDFIFPAGWLREPRRSARRADAIIISKCPSNMKNEEMAQMKNSASRFSSATVFFTSLAYQEPVPFGSNDKLTKKVILVSAIANNYLFRNHCATNYQVVKHFTFPDHHYCSNQEVKSIVDFAKSHEASIITTEKDMVKLVEMDAAIKGSPWFYLPIQVKFLNDEDKFHGMIFEKVRACQTSQN